MESFREADLYLMPALQADSGAFIQQRFLNTCTRCRTLYKYLYAQQSNRPTQLDLVVHLSRTESSDRSPPSSGLQRTCENPHTPPCLYVEAVHSLESARRCLASVVTSRALRP